MTQTYDAIVLGARCAGAPAAMLLARKGHRVLLVDRAEFPSDTVSTHVIHAPGIAALRRWGLLEEVIATGAPAIDRYRFDFGPIQLAGTPLPADDGGRTAYAPRRIVLDKILVDAAARAGVEVREGFTVDDVVFDDGTVVGIQGRSKSGRTVTERARVVIGADGRNSRLARAVQPPAYNEKPVLQGGAYTYWQDLPVDGFEITDRHYRGWAAVATNDGLTLVVVGWPAEELAAFRADVEGNYLKTLELEPAFAERVRGATRVDRFTFGSVTNYFRKPYGRGWVLVGDAGYNKDPITAQGITDAFHDAERCATALDDVFCGRRDFVDAMSAMHETRDRSVMAMYEFTTQLATLEPPPPEMQQLFGALAASPAGCDAFASVTAGTLSPATFFEPSYLEGILGAAGARAPA